MTIDRTTHKQLLAAAGAGRPVALGGRGQLCERGTTTAEYAIMVLVAVAFAGVLYAAVKNPAVTQMFTEILSKIAVLGGKIR